MRVRNGKKRWGGAVVEMALCMPLLIMIAFGTVDYGYFFYVKHTVQGAAREGARAAITPTAANSDVVTAVWNSLTAANLIPRTTSQTTAAITAAGYTIAMRNTSDTSDITDVSAVSSGTGILIKVSASWGTVGVHSLPTALGGIANSKTLLGSSVMRKEG